MRTRRHPGLRAAIAVAVAVCGGASTSIAAVGTAAAQLSNADGEVRFVHTIAGEPSRVRFSLNGEAVGRTAFGRATAFVRVPAGQAVVGVETTRGSPVVHGIVAIAANCRHTVIAAEISGLGEVPQLVEHSECTRHRLPAGATTVRLVNATGDLGSVELLVSGAVSSAAAPFEVTNRLTVRGGELDVEVRDADGGEAFRRAHLDLSAGSEWTLVLAGGGETPIVLNRLRDGVQPAEPPDPTDPVNTGGVASNTMRGRRPPPAEPPARLRVPSIDVDAPIVALEADSAPVLHEALDGRTVAWFSGTQPPGALGTAVMAGHVAFDRHPAVFGRLGALRAGDGVEVVDTDGRTSRFTVRGSLVVRKGTVSPDLYGPAARPTLILISCTGPVDPGTGLHRDNLFVLAEAA